MESRIYQLYLELLETYGSAEKYWPQWCAKKKTPKLRELIAIGAILVQRTSWHNAHLALLNLRKNGLLSLEKIAGLPNLDRLTKLIRPAGFYQSKPQRLYDFCSLVTNKYRGLENLLSINLADIRQKLLSIPGIGPETADTIVLYALDKPSFIIDEYTRRFVKKRKITNKLDYYFLKSYFERCLPREGTIYQNYHTLIIVEQKGPEGSRMEKV